MYGEKELVTETSEAACVMEISSATTLVSLKKINSSKDRIGKFMLIHDNKGN